MVRALVSSRPAIDLELLQIMPHTLSILVPVYNELTTVEALLRKVAAVRFPIAREIVVVDDGSTDGSRDVLTRLADEKLITYVEHAVNQGKGAAVRTAASHATGDLVVIQDADLELEPNDLLGLLEPILSGKASVCYGTRFAPPVPWTLRRLPSYWANRVLNLLSNVINGIRITDFNTCYKMMNAKVMSQLDLTENGFAMEPEITAKIARRGISICERPVSYHPRGSEDGKKIRPIDFLRYLAAMLRYRVSGTGDRPIVTDASFPRPA